MTDNTEHTPPPVPATEVAGVTINPEIKDHEDLTIFDELVREYIALDHEIQPMKARQEEIKKVLRDLDMGTHDIAGAKVTISRNARLDAKKFADAYPQDQYPSLYKSAPDNTEIKRVLPPAVIERLQTDGEPRVSIK